MASLTAVTKGDEVARRRQPAGRGDFESVFEREHRAMVRLAFLLLGSQSLAEEAVQDAFARLLDRFDTVENPGAYVRTSTVNRCRDLLRRRKLERSALSAAPPSSLGEDGVELLDVLAALDQNRREVIVLRFYLGHSASEIAQMLGVAEGTVRSRMQRGLEDLRRQLDD